MRSVLLIGDSMAQGLAGPLSTLADAAGVSFDSFAKSGTHISQWVVGSLAQGLGAKLAARPEVVLVALGTNDEKLSPAAAQGELPALSLLLGRLKGFGSRVAWIGPPTLPYANGVGCLIRRAAPDYFDSRRLLLERAGDGVHMTGSGYATWASAVWSWARRPAIVRIVDTVWRELFPVRC